MLQLGYRAGLALEPLDEGVVRAVLVVEDLEGNVPLEQGVTGLVDARHAAVADELLHLVPSGDLLPHHERKATQVLRAACV